MRKMFLFKLVVWKLIIKFILPLTDYIDNTDLNL